PNDQERYGGRLLHFRDRDTQGASLQRKLLPEGVHRLHASGASAVNRNVRRWRRNRDVGAAITPNLEWRPVSEVKPTQSYCLILQLRSNPEEQVNEKGC